MPMSSGRTSVPQINCASPSSTNVRPMVAMNSEICGWFTSGRSTMRSIRMPSTTITASVSDECSSQNGSANFSCRPTKVSAAKNTIAPWAKLNTPEAL